MGTVSEGKDILELLGLEPQIITPLLIVVFILILAIYIIFSKEFSKFSDKFMRRLTPIRDAILEIQTILRKSGEGIHCSLMETRSSPLRPSELGLKLVKDSGLFKIIENNKKELLAKLEKKLKKPFTKYDIQEKAREVLLNYKDKSMLIPVKQFAFKEGFDVEIILRTGGLILRDKYFEEHD